MSDVDPPTAPGGAPPAPPAAPSPRPRSRTGARLLVGIVAMGVVTLVAAVVGVAVLASSDLSELGLGEAEESSADEGYLEVTINGSIADAPGDVGLTLDPNDFPLLLTEVAASIRRAAKDEAVKGLYLEVESAPGGWAATQELRAALVDWRASGKPCHAWSQGYDNKAYYLASACDDVYLAPAGIMLVNGFEVTGEYYAGTLEKVGVKANLEHVGDFKSAVEPYERTGPSDAASLATNELLDALYEEFVAGVAEGRGLTPEAVRALIDDPPMAPEAAVAAGLVDALEYRDAIREGKAGKERIKVRKYRAPEPSMFASPKVIAVVHAEGQIVSGESGNPVFGGSVVGDETVVGTLDDLSEDESVVAVVLRVNSPGGSGLASDNIWHAIERLQAEGKPVVTSMGDYAASGGYYIAAGTDHIVAEPSTITGSIGVFGGKMNVAGLYEKLGITTHTWKRGEQSGLLSPTSDFSEPERAKFRTYLESFYTTFLARVSDGRKMERDAVHAVAQGRVWTGRQALERGLVDGLGGLDTAIAKAEELAKLEEGVEVRVDRYPKRKTFLEQLAEDLQPEVSAPIELRLLPGGAELWAEALTLARVLEDGGVAAMLPMRLDVR